MSRIHALERREAGADSPFGPAPAREVGKLRATLVIPKIGCVRERNNPAVSVVSCRNICSRVNAAGRAIAIFLDQSLRCAKNDVRGFRKSLGVTGKYIRKNLRCTQEQLTAQACVLNAAIRILPRKSCIDAGFRAFNPVQQRLLVHTDLTG